MDKCKECFNDFHVDELIYPERGYPYCKKCFSACLSLDQKKRFVPKHGKDKILIGEAIKESSELIDILMGALNKQSDKTKNKLGSPST